MKFTLFALFLLALPLASRAADLKTVDYVDPAKYVGRWYQIQHNPMPFEPTVCLCAQQSLSLQADSKLAVYNSCNEGTTRGPLREIRGTATNEDPISNSRFSVDFGLAFKGEYWIIGLDSGYRWAVVSDPTKSSLYILSKTPDLDPSLVQDAIKKAAEQVSISSLQATTQAGCQYPEGQ